MVRGAASAREARYAQHARSAAAGAPGGQAMEEARMSTESRRARAVAEKEAKAVLHDLLERTSRTFALAIPLLPGPLDRAVTVSYLLFRIADTFEDERYTLEQISDNVWMGLRSVDGLYRFASYDQISVPADTNGDGFTDAACCACD